MQVQPMCWKIFWSRIWKLTPVFLPGKLYGQRSLAGYSPWGRGESDMTERLSTAQHSTKPSVFPTSADTKTLKVKLTPNKHLLSEDIQE